MFSEGKEELDFALDEGEETVFRHRLVIFTGPFSAEQAETSWKSFVAEYAE